MLTNTCLLFLSALPFSCKQISSASCCHSVTKLCPTLCDPMDCSTPGFPVLHYLPEFAQSHVHWGSDAIQPSRPLLPPFLLPSILLSLKIFSNELTPRIRWPKYWSFSVSPSSEGWFPLVVVIVLVAQSCPTLCDPMDRGPPVSSVHGILQTKILEWIAIAFSRGSFDPGIEPGSPPLQADSYHLSYREEDPLGFPLKKKWSEVTLSCPTLCDPMDYNLPGFSIHGIFQARVLEWVAGLSYCILPFTLFLQVSFTNLLCNSSRSHLLVCTFLNL